MEKRNKKEGEPKLYERYEIDALSSNQPEAMTIYYNVVPQIAMSDSKEKVWQLYKAAMLKLHKLFGRLARAKEDLARLDLLLLRRVWAKIQELDGGNNAVDISAQLKLSPEETREIDSLQDGGLKVMATEIYGRLVLQMEAASQGKLNSVYESGRSVLSRIYEESDSRTEDLSKWNFMLINRFAAIAKKFQKK